MNDADLIKERLKKGKKKIKENTKEKNSKPKIVTGIILGFIQSLSLLLFSTNMKWSGFAVICYLCLTSFAIIKIYATISDIKHKKNKKTASFISSIDRNVSFKRSFLIISTLCSMFTLYVKDFEAFIYIAPIVNIIVSFLVSADMNYDLSKAYDELFEMEKLAKKAIYMELNKSLIIVAILSVIGGAILAKIYSSIDDSGVFLILLGTCVVSSVWNLIAKIILNTYSKKREEVLNSAFDLKMGNYKPSDRDSVSLNYIHVICSLNVFRYRIIANVVAFIILLILSKFNLSVSVIMITFYTSICFGLLRYDEGAYYFGTETTVANIYDANGNKTGSIKKY